MIRSIHGIIQSKSTTPTLIGDFAGGANSAYSLRYVRSGYSGDVIRVRRSSDSAELDFNPTEITDGTLTSWVGANDGFIVTFYDQSGVDDMTMSTTASQPKIVDNGTLVNFGGTTGILFDGTDDHFDAGATNLGITAGDTALTIAAWVYVDAFSNFPAIIGRTKTTTPFGGYQLNLTTTDFFDLAINVSGTWRTWGNLGGVGTGSANKWHFVVATYDGTDFRMYIDGTLNSAQTSAGTIQFAASLNNAFIGRNGTAYAQMKLESVLVYSGVASSTDVSNMYSISKAPFENSLLTNLVSYHTYDNADVSGATLSDSHGSYNGTITSATTGSAGILNEAFTFDGVNDKVAFGDMTEMDNTAAISINLWFKDSSAGSGGVLTAKYNAAPGCWEVSYNATDFIWRTWNNAGTQDFLLTPHAGYFDGNWHMMTVTYNNGSKKIYVDGVEIATASPYTGNLRNTTHPVQTGARSFPGAELWYSGDLDEVGYWDRELSADDVLDLWNGGNGLSYTEFQ